MTPQLFIATKAFVVHDDKVLIVRESRTYEEGTNAGKFDVPGGRVKPGERFDKSLAREVREETGLTITIGNPFFANEWRPIVKGNPWQVVGIYFICYTEKGNVKLGRDHDMHEWIEAREYGRHPLIENVAAAFNAFIRLQERMTLRPS